MRSARVAFERLLRGDRVLQTLDTAHAVVGDPDPVLQQDQSSEHRAVPSHFMSASGYQLPLTTFTGNASRPA